MLDVLKRMTGMRYPRCAPEKIVEKYNTILPEIQDKKEKLWYLLTHDISEIKQEYKATFAPETEPRKKGKKDQKHK